MLERGVAGMEMMEVELTWLKGCKGPLVIPKFVGSFLPGIDRRGMRLLCGGSVVGLAQSVVLCSVGVRRGVWLATDATEEHCHLEIGRRGYYGSSIASCRSLDIGKDAMHCAVTSEPTDSCVSDCEGTYDMSVSEVTVTEQESSLGDDPDMCDIDYQLNALPRVDLGKVEAIKLVSESTKAVGIGRVLNFETFSTAVNSYLYVVDALLMDMRKAHQFISGDIVNNLRKVTKAIEATNTSNIEDMVLNELQMGVKYKNSGREALLWLKRSLVFIYTSSKYAVERDDPQLVKTVKDAYNDSLAPCHGFKSHAVRFMMNGLPERDVFFGRLGSDRDEAIRLTKQWLKDLEPILRHLCDFCTKNRLEKVGKCKRLS